MAATIPQTIPFVVGGVPAPTLDLTLALGAPVVPHPALALPPETRWAVGEPRSAASVAVGTPTVPHRADASAPTATWAAGQPRNNI